MMKKQWISWIEIPANNFDRAVRFYEEILEIEIAVKDFGSFRMGTFGDDHPGAICYGEWYKPSENGPLIYFNANPDLNTVLERVEMAGGEVISHKKQISESMGYMGLFIDSEGNRLALKSDG